MNKITLIGRLTADPNALVSEKSGRTICPFILAVDRKDKGTNTDFIPCVSFDKTADAISKYFVKGQRIAVIGSLQGSKYEKDGKPNIYWKVYVHEFDFCESRDRAAQPEPKQQAADYADVADEDFPF